MEFWDKFKKKKKNKDDILLQVKADRRLLENVPDEEKIRKNRDRRGSAADNDGEETVHSFMSKKNSGIRYVVDYDVKIIAIDKTGKQYKFTCKGVDISTTGILLRISQIKWKQVLENAKKIKIKFEITQGSMPEGYEMKIRTQAKLARTQVTEEQELLAGLEFHKTLSQYANHRKGRYTLFFAGLFLFAISAFIVLMRAESVIYFKFNKWLYLYSIIAAGFLLSRYLFSMFYRVAPIDPEYTPGVSILIPCFNEEQWIQRTILSCINQDYPVDKLEVIVIDDCSADKSVEKIQEILDRLYNEVEQFKTRERLKCIVQHKNAGKREALVLGVEAAKHDLVVFVDSDSFLDPFAIRNLVQPFKDPKMGGCAGRTDVANTYTNNLTKMQAVRYYIAFRIMKAAEGFFDTVSCLSGPLSCYRKDIIMEHKDEWLQQKFLGQKATFGDDRSMTNFVLRKHRTAYQDTAICSTIVPNSHKVFLKQQMRWKRSWLRESLIAGKFMWKKEPFAAISFYMGLIVPIAAPIVVLYNLVYVPITHRIFPTTFLVGILMMSMLMSMAQLFLRKSTTWLYGMFFCIYYEVVLLWQMPVAWVTFWKSTWGTRMTPSDILAARKRKALGGARPEEEEKVLEDLGTVKREGLTVITAWDSVYLENDSTLTPMTGMLLTEVADVNDGFVLSRKAEIMEESENLKEIKSLEETGSLKETESLEDAEPSEEAEFLNEIDLLEENTSAKASMFSKKTEQLAGKQVVYANAHTDKMEQIIQEKLSDMAVELSKVVVREIKESIMPELKRELKEQLLEEVRDELKVELIAEIKQQLLQEVRNEERRAI